MKHLKRPFLLIANGLVILSSLTFLILGFAVGMMEKLARERVSPAELANPEPIIRSDAMQLVDLCQIVMAYCWFFAILFAIIAFVNFWLIPWRSLRPQSVSKCEPDSSANGSQPFRSEAKAHVIGGWPPSLTLAFADELATPLAAAYRLIYEHRGNQTIAFDRKASDHGGHLGRFACPS